VTAARGGRSLLLFCGAAFMLVAVTACLAIAWNWPAVRTWLARAYPDDPDLSAVERALAERHGAANVRVSWISDRPPRRVNPERLRGRRVGVQVVNSPLVSNVMATGPAWEVARLVRDHIVGPVPPVEVVLLRNIHGQPNAWESHTHWFTADALARDRDGTEPPTPR
jgi:hypothetical protein